MTRRSSLHLETLEDRLTPASTRAIALIAAPAKVVNPTPIVVHLNLGGHLGGQTMSPAAGGILGGGGGGGSSGGGGGGLGGSSGNPVG